jgi:hypothetical protein
MNNDRPTRQQAFSALQSCFQENDIGMPDIRLADHGSDEFIVKLDGIPAEINIRKPFEANVSKIHAGISSFVTAANKWNKNYDTAPANSLLKKLSLCIPTPRR